MPRFGAISRKDLIYYLRQLGFAGPYSGGKHQFMSSGSLTLRIPQSASGRHWERVTKPHPAASGHQQKRLGKTLSS